MLIKKNIYQSVHPKRKKNHFIHKLVLKMLGADP